MPPCSRWCEKGILPIDVGFMSTLFSVIAMIAITNTTLVAVVTQPRILYGMAREDVVPGVFAKIHSSRRSPWVGLLFSGTIVCALLVVGTLAPNVEGAPLIERLSLVTVVFLLFIYALVIVSCLKLRGHDESERTYRANTPLLLVGLVGNVAILGYVIYDDPTSLYWCAGLVACRRRALPDRVPLRQAHPATGRRARGSRSRHRNRSLTCTSSSPLTVPSSPWPPRST